MTKTKRLLRNKWLLTGAVLSVLMIIAVVAVSSLIMGSYGQYILHDKTSMQTHRQTVGIVLGAGITKDGKPYRELQSRLDVAADAMQSGYVQKLIVSGDNRFYAYDEPTAMKKYLVEERHIDADNIQPDFAGRSTYESCERAAKVFELNKAIIISAGSHLPRAVYLCRHFGVEAYGIASPAEANNANRRESVARVKALYNVYIHGENTILGTPIRVR